MLFVLCLRFTYKYASNAQHTEQNTKSRNKELGFNYIREVVPAQRMGVIMVL